MGLWRKKSNDKLDFPEVLHYTYIRKGIAGKPAPLVTGLWESLINKECMKMSEKIYQATKYIRKSYTDDKTNESDSVQNQRKLIDSFIESQPDIEAIEEKVDDGVSGVIFDRKAFKEMMADIESGKINCVIVKDLSRLGRDYIETGRYLRRIFPAYGVRFIAINDNIDTLRDSGDDLVVSVKSIINDAYSRDISIKIRSALNVKRESGEFVGACPVYGYRKSDGNRNQLVIDEYTANVVRDIFRMKINGMSALKISVALNDLGYLSPIEYKKDRGLPHPKGGYTDNDSAKWSPNTVIRILNNEIYTGTLIQGRQGTLNYKIKDIIDKPEAEWKRSEDAHEAIITKHDFDLAQKIMRLDTRTAPGGATVYMFSGILICDCCGARMTRKTVPYKDGKYYYYYCPTTKKRGCADAVNLKESDLVECILESIKAHVANVTSLDSIIASSDGQRMANAAIKQYSSQVDENERQLAQIGGFKSTLYENMINGIISKDDYKTLKAKYAADEIRLHGAIAKLSQEIENVLAGKGERLRWTEHFKRFDGLTEIDRRTVISLIHSIRIVSKTELVITFNYQAEYENALTILRKEAA
jgi:DNA invertase Pin-like site-specific DNA recombinase